ncbi:SgcJ/EcaC family oxidoreductase [Polyangium jinanense]|uniref:SgcJ/EcaC family oxidoreductase n=1 Tax=Polyangium jinanense TaxID=2829994 RepID=A0A9X4AY39_9BACT|nr:SgcJ/EcaC family oxidoreductase [Polyangium jinanense]MDC3960460.1 SgcJ/EcaC family oxidoreductase [Polyangium jinanense]MDC3986767.1 SgcJ/EcaC family oxidoreductase [Polyangium jinanense]
MNRFARSSAIMALFLSCCVSACDPAEKAQGASQGASQNEEASLRKLVAEQTEAWNRHDAAAWSKAFAPDAEFINIVGTIFSGRDEIQKRHALLFESVFKDSHTEVTVRKLRLIDSNVAVVDTDHVVTGYAALPPGVQATEQGVLRTRMRYVMKQSGGMWSIVAGQNTDVKPAPAPPSQPAPASSGG